MVLSDGAEVSPKELFQNLGWSSDWVNWMTLVIVNYLDKPLVEVGQWMNQGVQAGYPVESDLVGAYVTGLNGFPDCAGTPGGSIASNQIPAARKHPFKPGSTLYGVGAYQFAQSSVVYGAEGAIEFEYDGATRIAIAFASPCKSIFYPSLAPGCGVTADMSKHAGDLQTFYKAASPDQGATKQSDRNTVLTIAAAAGSILNQNDPQVCVTVSVSPL